MHLFSARHQLRLVTELLDFFLIPTKTCPYHFGPKGGIECMLFFWFTHGAFAEF